ncbi:unnamed protein product [Cunninghamella blakesleeana]
MAPNQSNNNGSNNNRSNEIRGPTSALSEFLREQGIRIPNRSRREIQRRRQQQNNDTASTPTASESASAAANTDSPETEPTMSDSNNNENTTSILYTPPTTTTTITTRSKRARDADAQSILNTASTSKKALQQKNKKKLLSKRKRKAKKGNDSSDSSSDSDSSMSFHDSDDSSDDFRPGPSRRAPEGRNLILFCYECKKRFSRPRSSADNDYYLQDDKSICPSCISGNIKPTSKKKQKKSTHVPTKINSSKNNSVPSLQNICIDIVFEYIEDVEAFGDISIINMDKLAKIVCRNRLLNNKIARLFFQPRLHELALYDCTNIDADGLKNVAHFCPNLRTLNLNYCGRIDNDVIQLYKTHLPHLTSLSLGGCHLITHDTWVAFFKAKGQQLETFNLRHSYQFKKGTFKELLLHAKGLKHLRLSRIVTLSNDWLDLLVEHGPTHLQTLELSWPSEAPGRKHILTSEHMVRVLQRTGSELKELVLRGCQDMTDELLVDGILPHCHQLQHLVLEQSHQLTSNGFKKLFAHWKISSSQGYGCGLKHITIARCSQLKDDAFIALLCHSWKSLTHLNIHSLEHLSSDALEVIAGRPVPDLTPFEQLDDYDDANDNGDSNDENNRNPDDNTNEQEQQDNNNNNDNSTNSDDDNVQSPLENQKSKSIIIDKNMLSSLSACSSLTYLNASFVRSMDDIILNKLIQACPLLKHISVWGCNQVSDIQVPLKVTLEGREMSQVVL